jgi:hypothetical protein
VSEMPLMHQLIKPQYQIIIIEHFIKYGVLHPPPLK